VLDQEANGADKVAAQDGVVQDVGKEGVTPRVLVCRTDEQFEMARACAEDEAFW
jgi:acetate kinase